VTLSAKIDGFLAARGQLFDELSDLWPGDIEDQRGRRWNGDHGTVWWEDAEGKRHDASVFTRPWADRDGLYICWEPKRQLWLVFEKARCDEAFRW